MTKIFGHRGSSMLERENTLAAFARAEAEGADGVELDVRLAADGTLVVHHDPDIPGVGEIAALTRGQLPDWVPTLQDVLSHRGSLAINVEIKNLPDEPAFDPEERLAALVAELLAAETREALVSSFNRAALSMVRSVAPLLATGWLTLPTWDQQESVAQAKNLGFSAVHPHHVSVNAELCDAAHQAGLEVNTWTVDDPDRMVWLAGVGVDAVITNVPSDAVAALRRQ